MKRKSKRLVEAMTTKAKRVKQQAIRPGKRKKSLLTIMELSKEQEQEQEVKQAQKETTSKKSARKS